jgi:nitroreductase
VNFFVVEDREVMTQLREAAYLGIKEAVAEGQLPARLSFFRSLIPAWEKDGIDVIFRDAPHLLVATAPKRASSSEADCLIALSSFELLAQCQGVGTLWNGLAKWAIGKVVPRLRKQIGIPEDHTLGACMSFGRPAMEYHRTVQYEDASIHPVTKMKIPK